MRINIGPYLTWWGPYQLAELLLYWNYVPGLLEGRVAEHLLNRVRLTEDQTHKIGEWLADTWVHPVCEWIHSKRKRRIEIKIDRYDTWSMDHTLAMIIVPMLKQLKETKNGGPCVNDDDVPEGLGLRSTEAPPKKNDWDTDENWFKRWDWILSEIIWTFEQLASEDDESQFYDHSQVDESASLPKQIKQIKCDQDGLTAHWERMRRGQLLFGKYYQCLWD